MSRKVPVGPKINALIARARALKDNTLAAFDQSDAMPAIEAAIKAASDRSEAARVSLARAQERLSSPVPAMPEQVEFNTGDTLAIGLSGLFGGMQGAMKASSPVAKLAAERQARVYQNNLARWQQQQGLAEREYGRSVEDIRAERQLLATIEGEGRQYGRDRASQRLQLGLAGDAQIMDLEKIGLGHEYDKETLGLTQAFSREQMATGNANQIALANLNFNLESRLAKLRTALQDGSDNSRARRERLDTIQKTLAVADHPSIVDAMVSELKKNWKETLPPDMVEAYRAAAIARKNNTDLITGASVLRAGMPGFKQKTDDFGMPRGVPGGLPGVLMPGSAESFSGAEITPMPVTPPAFERPEQVWNSLDPESRKQYAGLVGTLRGLSEQKAAMLAAGDPKDETTYDRNIRRAKARESMTALDKEIRTTRGKLEASLSREFKDRRGAVAQHLFSAIKELSKKAKGRAPADVAQYIQAQKDLRKSFRDSFGTDIDQVLQ
jgi:hypothetical protein